MTALDRRRRHFSLSRAAQRLERHRLEFGLLVIAVMAFLSYLSIVAINGIPFASYEHLRALLPASGPILSRGDDVLIAGQRVGEVRSVVPVSNGRLASMTINTGERIGRDARAIIRLRGLAGATYLQILPGNPRRPAPANFTVPLARSSTNTQLTDVIAQFDRATRAAMSRTLEAYGPAIGGSGTSINLALAQLPSMLEAIRPILGAFSPAPGALAGMVHVFDLTTRGLAGQQPGDFGALLDSAARTLDAILSQRRALGRGIDELRPFSDAVQATLPLADPVLLDAAATARALDPTVSALDQALPGLSTLVGRSRQVAQLDVLARAADPVIAAARPALVRLWPAAASLSPLAIGIDPLAAYASRYAPDLLAAPTGFTTWGGFRYDQGQARGARAVRFAPIFTCSPGRDPYPMPGQALKERKPCPAG
ncbi:MAG TPA: MlaD family protein [Solirubrobacteraceae bacterium]|nr:MlaD family protein [Solirubrobacteraceae bacterium]